MQIACLYLAVLILYCINMELACACAVKSDAVQTRCFVPDGAVYYLKTAATSLL